MSSRRRWRRRVAARLLEQAGHFMSDNASVPRHSDDDADKFGHALAREAWLNHTNQAWSCVTLCTEHEARGVHKTVPGEASNVLFRIDF